MFALSTSCAALSTASLTSISLSESSSLIDGVLGTVAGGGKVYTGFPLEPAVAQAELKLRSKSDSPFSCGLTSYLADRVSDSLSYRAAFARSIIKAGACCAQSYETLAET
ncbi:hypothetical protein ABVK25_006770 [Lepraria finkii]|uniref:Uncharacterized protein n=1 Tax=Lepraria finkii TaxID=1340010 RepID=A0ABR4B7J8_9LECA